MDSQFSLIKNETFIGTRCCSFNRLDFIKVQISDQFHIKFHNFTGLCSAQAGYDPARDARLILHTRQNRAGVPITFNADQIRGTTFLASRPTRFVTHGWLGSDEVDIIAAGVPALLNAGDFNVIAMDWSLGADSLNYALVVSRAGPTGRFLATFLDFLHENNFIEFSRVHVIGFSLGAHVVGHVGKAVTRGQIDTIIGLDPGMLIESTYI